MAVLWAHENLPVHCRGRRWRHYLLTPLIRHIAIENRRSGEVRARDVHTVPTPRMGGLGMLIGFTVAMLFASRIPFIEACSPNRIRHG